MHLDDSWIIPEKHTSIQSIIKTGVLHFVSDIYKEYDAESCTLLQCFIGPMQSVHIIIVNRNPLYATYRHFTGP